MKHCKLTVTSTAILQNFEVISKKNTQNPYLIFLYGTDLNL